MKRYLVILSSCVTLAANAAAQEVTALNCRAQIVLQCEATCDATQQPADLSLDFSRKTGSYCRGSRCDEADLWSTTASGQWDDAPYIAFRLSGKGASPFTVLGAIAVKPLIFGGSADDIGMLTGTCERPE